MIIKKELKHITGNEIIKFIKENLGQTLPLNGFLAGQSVTSVVLYLMGKNSMLNINDYDVFYFRNYTGDSGSRLINRYDSNAISFIDTNYLPKIKKENVTVDSIDDLIYQIQEEKRKKHFLSNSRHDYVDDTIKEKDLIKVLLSIANNDKESLNGLKSKNINRSSPYVLDALTDFASDDRDSVFADKVRKILRRKGIIGNATPSLVANFVNKDTYRILDVEDEDLINKIVVYFNSQSYNMEQGKKLDVLNYYKQYSIISNFDINANQVGVDLATGNILYTPNFVEFTKGQQLKIVNLQRYWHALSRYITKKEIHGYFGNDECEIDKVMTYHSLKNSINLHESFIQEGFIMPYLGNRADSKIKMAESPLMGKRYLELCKSSKMLNYLKIKKTFKAKDNAETKLYELTPKTNWDNEIIKGLHKERLEKIIGKELLGYQLFTLLNINNIMSSEYNLTSKKKLNNIISYSKDISKVDFKNKKLIKKKILLDDRKNIIGLYNQKILEKILEKGHYEIGNMSRISKFIDSHPESLEFFNRSPTEDWLNIISKFKEIEETSYRVFGYWLKNYVDLTPKEFLTTSMEELETIAYENSKNSLKPLRDLIFNKFEYNNIIFEEIITSFELNDLGHKMRNCIGGYDGAVAAWNSSILLLKDIDSDYMSVAELKIPTSLQNDITKHFLYGKSYDVRIHKFEIIQHREKLNKSPKERHAKALISFIKDYNKEVDRIRKEENISI